MSNNSDEFKNLDTFIPAGVTGRKKDGILNDPATFLARNKKQYIEIYHIPSDQSIKFKAYIEDYSDQYSSEWQEEMVYGRMDPIVQFQGTKRVISLDWVVPAVSIEEAKFNHEKCSLLFTMLYPAYEDSTSSTNSSALRITTAPIFKVKFANLIKDPTGGDGNAKEAGLVGTISGFTYKPDFEQGFVGPDMSSINSPLADAAFEGAGVLWPKAHKLSMEYTVLHTFKLGWDGQKKKRTPNFPYGVGQGAANQEAGGSDGNMVEVNESQVNSVLMGD